jgi:hypothetical protein
MCGVAVSKRAESEMLLMKTFETASGDHEEINLDDTIATTRWCKQLGCTVFKLRRAVRMVGREADRVRAYIEDRGRYRVTPNYK